MRRSHRLSSFLPVLSSVVVLVIFAIAVFAVRGSLEANRGFQQDLRGAQLARARVLTLQLDEETGIRGYAATGDSTFLAPYRAALSRFSSASALLVTRLQELSIDPSPAREEAAIDDRWLLEVARPLLADMHTSSTLATERRGKVLVDAFRAQDAQIQSALSDTADRADAATAHTVSQTLTIAIVLGVALAVLLGWLGFVQRRLSDELEMQRQAYFEEKRVADALQEAFLQTSLPQVARAELHAVYVPAGGESRVGGDWYDAFELEGNRILFSIGDVAGHGVGAAVVMSRVRQAMLSVGIEEHDPATVLERANEILLLQNQTMVTAICGVIDLGKGIVTIANAGHPPAIVMRGDGEIEKLGATGPPLGALDHPKYTTRSVMTAPGSMLTLYTDGLVEHGRNWEQGEQDLLDALRDLDVHAADPAAELMRRIFGEDPGVDDVAILTVTFRDGDDRPMRPQAHESASGRPLVKRSFRALLASVTPAPIPVGAAT